MDLMIIALLGAVVALGYAAYLAKKVTKYSEGTEEMVTIAAAIREGANTYLKRQYKTVGMFFGAMFVILMAFSFLGFMDYMFCLLLQPL